MEGIRKNCSKNFPEFMRKMAKEQFLRQPKTAYEARAQVDALKKAGVDCVKAVLEAGNPTWGQFNHLDPDIYRAVISEARNRAYPPPLTPAMRPT